MKGALLLLIIGVVMCQHSLRGFPPEGTIPQGPRHWNHITALVCALACFFLWLELEKEERAELNTWKKNALFGSFLSIFRRTLTLLQSAVEQGWRFFFFFFKWHKPTEFEISPVWLIPEPLDKWMLLKLCFRFKIRCRTRKAVQENIITLKMKYSILVENIHNSFDVMMSMCYVTKHANQLAWPFLVQSSHSKGVNTDTSPVLPG